MAGCWRKLTVIKNDTAREASSTKYLLTNACHLTNLEHIFWYRKRWAIEPTFGWLNLYRRLSKDYEFSFDSSKAIILKPESIN
jgi:transposase